MSFFLVFDIISLLQALEPFFEKFDPDFIDIRTKSREVLQREDDLNEIVQVHMLARSGFCQMCSLVSPDILNSSMLHF